MKRVSTELKWAIIYSISELGWTTFEKLIGLHDTYIQYHPYITSLFGIIVIVIILFYLLEKKRKSLSEELTFSKVIVSSFRLAIYIILLLPLILWVSYAHISPEFFPNAIQKNVNIGFFKTLDEAQNHYNYFNYLKQASIGVFLLVTISTAILSAFIQKNSDDKDDDISNIQNLYKY